jgi:hypothetical protein
MGSSLVLSCERVHEGVMRRSELMMGPVLGVVEGTVIRREMSGVVWRAILGMGGRVGWNVEAVIMETQNAVLTSAGQCGRVK